MSVVSGTCTTALHSVFPPPLASFHAWFGSTSTKVKFSVNYYVTVPTIALNIYMQIKGYKAGISKAECSCKANIKPNQLELYWSALSYLRTIIHFSGPISKDLLSGKIYVYLIISKHK